MLGGSTSSRLDTRLLHEDKLVDSVSRLRRTASQLGSNFLITADVKQGVDPAKVEAVIDEETASACSREGPTAAELEQAAHRVQGRLRARHRAHRRLRRQGRRAGRVRRLHRQPGLLPRQPARSSTPPRRPTCKAIGNEVARARATTRWWWCRASAPRLPEDPSVTPAPLTLPAVDPKYTTTASTVDRSKGVPLTRRFPDLKFPALQRATLKNGTQVILAERHDMPVVQMSYEFHGGFSADQGRKLGTSSFAMGMLDEGAGELDALAFGDRAESLGANIGAGASLDGGNGLPVGAEGKPGPVARPVRRRCCARRASTRRRSTASRRPGSPASSRRRRARNGAALRVLPPLLYGDGHAYAMPFSGSGTEASIGSLTRDDLVAFHRDWVRPDRTRR